MRFLGLFSIPWIQILVGGLLVLVEIRNVNAAPCEFDGWTFLPEITEVRTRGSEILLLTKTLQVGEEPTLRDERPMRTGAYLYDAKRQIFTLVSDKVVRTQLKDFSPISKGPALIPEDEFLHGETRFKICPFGISVQEQKCGKVIKIPGLSPKDINRNGLDGYTIEEGAEIAMGILQGDWFIAGLNGGFPEGEGRPGGIAFFSIPKRQWFLKWDELLYQRVTSMIPLGNRILVTTVKPEEFSEVGGGVFLVDPMKMSVQTMSVQTILQELKKTKMSSASNEYVELESYEAIKIGEEILIKGHYGVALLTADLKVKNLSFWLKDFAPDGEIIERLIEKNEWVKWKGQNLTIFYAVELLRPNNKKAFIEIATKAKEPIGGGNDNYLPGTNVGCGQRFQLPLESMPYLDIPALLYSKGYLKVMTAIQLIRISKDPQWLALLKGFPVLGRLTWTDDLDEEVARVINELEKLKTK